MNSFDEKIQRADSATAKLATLLRSLKETPLFATGGNPELKRAVDGVLVSITETKAGLQSIRTQQDELEGRLQQVSVEEKELVEKDEYLQKWQEKLDMQEKVLNSSGSRLKKREVDITDEEARLQEKQLRLKSFEQEARKVVTDAKLRSKQVASAIEAFDAQIAQLEVAEGQPEQQASSNKRSRVLSSTDLNSKSPSGRKRARPVPLPKSPDPPTSSVDSSPDTRRQRLRVHQRRRSKAARETAAQSHHQARSAASEGRKPSTQGQRAARSPSETRVQIAPEVRHIWNKLVLHEDITVESRQKLANLIRVSDSGKRAAAARAEPILERCSASTEKGEELCLTSSLKTITPKAFLLNSAEKPDYTVACDRCHPRWPCLRASWAGEMAKDDKDLPTRWIIEQRAVQQEL
ncbi:MAG: hypothetical protein Q9216_000045 [Gyalolechia sp. 2 TL-2023]